VHLVGFYYKNTRITLSLVILTIFAVVSVFSYTFGFRLSLRTSSSTAWSCIPLLYIISVSPIFPLILQILYKFFCLPISTFDYLTFILSHVCSRFDRCR